MPDGADHEIGPRSALRGIVTVIGAAGVLALAGWLIAVTMTLLLT